MAKKKSAPWRIAPLQRIVAEPITDADEQARLDLVRRRQVAGRADLKCGLGRVLKKLQGLAERDRVSLLGRLAARLPAPAQLDCLAQMLAAVPPEVLRELEQELSPRLAR
jgi:hypothetical protein